jgi:SAM-dependent methyltransferase
MYRVLGNTVGAQKRSSGKLPAYYISRVKRLLNSIQKYEILNENSNLLELGTGWFHWEALTARLFYNFKATLFDVWDNRQLPGLKNYINQLKLFLPEFAITDDQRKHATILINRIATTDSFEKLYSMLGFTYAVSSDRIVNICESNSFDAVISAGVMEHIHKDKLPQLLSDLRKILKPNGYSIHSINLRDHLSSYDRSISCKQYLRYSDSHWSRWFENDVQYINRIQKTEWIKLFDNAGFIMLDEECEKVNLPLNQVSDKYLPLGKSNLETTWLKCVHINDVLTYNTNPYWDSHKELAKSSIC